MATQFETFISEEMPQRAAYLTIDNTGYSGDPNLAVLGKINDAPRGTWFLNDIDNTLWYKKVKADPMSWEQLQGSQGTINLRANCDASDAVGHAVYCSGDKVGDFYQVTRVDIDNADKKKAVAMGIIIAKTSSTICIVQTRGPVADVKTGMTPGAAIFINPNATLREGPPSRPPTGARMRQSVGFAIADNTFIVNISRPVLVQASV